MIYPYRHAMTTFVKSSTSSPNDESHVTEGKSITHKSIGKFKSAAEKHYIDRFRSSKHWLITIHFHDIASMSDVYFDKMLSNRIYTMITVNYQQGPQQNTDKNTFTIKARAA